MSKLRVIARNADWFVALFAPVVIGPSYYFGVGFPTVIWKLLYFKLFLVYTQVLKKNLSADALKFSIVEKKDEGKQVNNEVILHRQYIAW